MSRNMSKHYIFYLVRSLLIMDNPVLQGLEKLPKDSRVIHYYA